MRGEAERQRWKIELIASENYTFAAVMEAQGSWLTNKYAEGLPGRRYYGGCEWVDVVERLAQERALALFPGAAHVNVQPHSGAQANQAAFFAVLTPGDRILGLRLDHGGHLTHGLGVNMSGRWFEAHHYGLDPVTETDRLRRPGAPGRGGPPEAPHRRGQHVLADPRLRAPRRDRPRRGGPPPRGHGPHRGAGRGRASTRRRSPTPTSSPPRPTRRCAGRAAGSSSPRPSSRRRSIGRSSRASRAARSCT